MSNIDKVVSDTEKNLDAMKNGDRSSGNKMIAELNDLRKEDKSSGKDFNKDLQTINDRLHKDGYLPGLDLVDTKDTVAVKMHTPAPGEPKPGTDNGGKSDGKTPSHDAPKDDGHKAWLIDDMKNIGSDAWNGASHSLGAMRDGLHLGVDLATLDFKGAAKDGGQLLSDAGGAIGNGFGLVKDTAGLVWDGVKAPFVATGDVLGAGWEDVKHVAKAGLAVRDAGEDTLHSLVDIATLDPKGLIKDGGNVVKDVVKVGEEGVGIVKDTVKGAFHAVGDFLGL